jgi:putative membrane protein|tara:strand:+ start:6650 stop:7591 length:942 start_codon:yes stop_codon:yes gene_type:complete
MNGAKLAIAKRDALYLFLKGMAMGAAEVVPGVSGGTIAFITGIYERLLNAIRSLTPGGLLVLKNRGVAACWRHIDGSFLVVLFLGMAVSILTVAQAVSVLLHQYPVGLWAFFFGLIVASSLVIGAQIETWHAGPALFTLVGMMTGLIVSNAIPIELEATPLFIFAGGAIAVCAWILPGLSGSFILLILGLYTYVIEAIRNLDLVVLSILAVGCAAGLLSFSHFLSHMLKRFRDETLATLTGFMLGSLTKVWPWKHTLSYQLDGQGKRIPLVQEAVTPETYIQLTGADPQLALAAMLALAGFATVLMMQKLTKK